MTSQLLSWQLCYDTCIVSVSIREGSNNYSPAGTNIDLPDVAKLLHVFSPRSPGEKGRHCCIVLSWSPSSFLFYLALFFLYSFTEVTCVTLQIRTSLLLLGCEHVSVFVCAFACTRVYSRCDTMNRTPCIVLLLESCLSLFGDPGTSEKKFPFSSYRNFARQGKSVLASPHLFILQYDIFKLLKL